MKQKWEIIFSGVGGQGLVSCGNLLGEAAAQEGLRVAMTTSYGVETRGTFTKSDVILSREEIDYPEALAPDVILTLADVAYRRYAPQAGKDTILLYDQGAVTPVDSDAPQYGFPIRDTAEEMGNPASANILALGILLGKTGLLEEASLCRAIEKAFASNPKAVEKNKAILRRGIEMAAPSKV